MGFIFRAYFAPMARLNSPAGMPTKVPYLFSNMLRKLQKEHAPDYLAVVFDTREPTFRDKLFDKYKAQRPPMPDDLAIQLPYVRRMCEAMRLPILEFDGFEADDVIGALAKQAAKKGLDVSIVTSDKDMMQLVGGNVRVLRPGAGPDKTDLIVDAAKVEEIMGVPPEKVADVMALMGDSIDNIPGAKGIGEKGAKELIRRFGSAEAALDRAKEVEGKRYREALENSRDAVMMSKQLAMIDTNAPVKLVLDDLARSEPDIEALRAIYAELGFTSLLRDLPAAAAATAALVPAIESVPLESPAALKKFLSAIPREAEIAVWLTLAEGENAKRRLRHAGCWPWKFRPKPGVSRTVALDAKGEMRAALGEFLQRPRARQKSCTIPSSSSCSPAPSPEFATRRCSIRICCGPPHRNTAWTTWCCGRKTSRSPARPANAPNICSASRRSCEKKWKRKASRICTRRSTCPLAPVLAAMERHGVRVDREALDAMSRRWSAKSARSKKLSGISPGRRIQHQFAACSLPKSCSTNWA